jgi:hypothetical protein
MVKVKGATKAEQPIVKAAKAAARKPGLRTTRQDETAEAKKSIPAKQEAADDQFARADAAVVGDDVRLRLAALGGL